MMKDTIADDSLNASPSNIYRANRRETPIEMHIWKVNQIAPNPIQSLFKDSILF